MTTPVIRCLKTQTGAEIHFVTKSAHKNILNGNPYVDKVYSFENEITEIVSNLKDEQYDFVVDLHNNIRSLRLKKILGRPSAAFPKLNIQKYMLTRFKWDLMPAVHLVDRYFEAVKKLDVKADGKGLDFFIQEKVDLGKFNIPTHFVAFAIGAKFATKRLPNNKIVEIIQKIHQPVVLLGGSEDVENAKKIAASCLNVISLVGITNLDQSASIVDQSSALITHDTGMMHIGAALQKRIVSVWGNTVPELGMYPYMPKHPDRYSTHEVTIKCRPCSKIGYEKCPKKHFRCMNDQDTDAIVAAL